MQNQLIQVCKKTVIAIGHPQAQPQVGCNPGDSIKQDCFLNIMYIVMYRPFTVPIVIHGICEECDEMDKKIFLGFCTS